eukprot:scaffold5.g788.t1
MADGRGAAAQLGGRAVESSDSTPCACDYVEVAGCRLVKPYYFDFVCTVRQRWLGQSIVDIFAREFPARSREYYLQALADGRLRVEGTQYRKNTVQGILAAERPDLGPLLPVHRHAAGGDQGARAHARVRARGRQARVQGTALPAPRGGCAPRSRTPPLPRGPPPHRHRRGRRARAPPRPRRRLDKPVSGLLLFARTKAAANALRQQIEGRGVRKVYVARVMGRFRPGAPEGVPLLVDVPLAWDPRTNRASAVPAAAAAASPAEEERLAGGRRGEAPDQERAGAGQEAAGAADAEQQGQVQRWQQQPGGGEGRDEEMATAEEELELEEAAESGATEDGAPARAVEAAAADGGPSAGPSASKRAKNKRAWKEQRRAKFEAKQARRAAEAAARAAAEAAGTAGAKPAATEFRLLAVAPDGLTSLVECRPLTGRTHQIRYAGHPIANDNQYGGTYPGPMSCRSMAELLGVAWEPDAPPSVAAAAAARAGSAGAGATGGEAAPVAAGGEAAAVAPQGGDPGQPPSGSKRQRLVGGSAGRADARQQLEHGAGGGAEPPAAAGGAVAASVGAAAVPQAAVETAAADIWAQNEAFRSRPEFEAPPELREGGALCPHCPYYAPRDYPADLRPLWLHARSYSCDDWSYGTDPPDWAAPGYVPDPGADPAALA